MPNQELFELRPTGWETDPADEYTKLTTLDYLPGQVYTAWALFFRLSDADKPAAVSTLRRGLEVTLSQCRQLCGIIEEHPDGGLCIHKKRDSTVQFHVQRLDGPEDEGKYPSFDDLRQRHFVSQALGALDTWCVSPMTYGEKPEAQPTSNPKVAAFKASFIRGGLVFMMHHHHYGNDIMGWAGELHQLAENCHAIWNSPVNPPLPPWDKANLDRARFLPPAIIPEDQLISGPPPPLRHPEHRQCQFLLFHLPKSKIATLKALASPPDGDKSYYISSYDAFTAYMWRILSKHRATIFHPSPSQPLIWGEAVELRRRFHHPTPIPPRTQGNLVLGALSSLTPSLPPLTAAEVISPTVPLSKLAWYIRQLTNSVTQQSVEAMLDTLHRIRDKTTLFLRTDSLPPMSNVITEWRDTKPSEADFGFGRPVAFRAPFDTVTAGLTLVYPPRTVDPPAGEDEGLEMCFGFEKELTKGLLEDPEWNRFFEFRGVDAEDQER